MCRIQFHTTLSMKLGSQRIENIYVHEKRRNCSQDHNVYPSLYMTFEKLKISLKPILNFF